MSGLPPLIGHEDVRDALGNAVVRGDLPGSILLHGPVGIGKQRLALWLAQRLVCERATDASPCERCRGCQLAVRLEHPDIHWFFPLARPKGSSSPDRLGEALEEARAAELTARRAEPWRPTPPNELMGIYLAQVLILRRMASTRPSMARRKVFIIGDAENLVSQEASPEAANALLKVLEEPPPDTTFLLTTSDPDELLPTIRSRLLPVRLQPLAPESVVALLEAELHRAPDEARLAARLGEGSIGRALAFLPRDGEAGPLEITRRRAGDLLRAALQPRPTERLVAAFAESPAGARGGFAETLDFLALWIRDLGAVAAGAQESVVNSDGLESLQALAGRLPGAGKGVPEALKSIDIARGMTRSNINPQLTLAWLLREIGQAILGPN